MQRDGWKFRVGVLLTFVGLMWFVWLLQLIAPGAVSAAGGGIVPRTWSGIDGIFVAPFIHRDLDHLLANTVPILILGGLILLRGSAEFGLVVIVSGLVGGIGTWLFGTGNSQHIGASGVLFGFFGYLVFRAAFDRRLPSILVTLVVAFAYGTAFAHSLIPRESISWSAHFFGFLGGLAAARMRYPAQPATDDPPRLVDDGDVVVKFPNR